MSAEAGRAADRAAVAAAWLGLAHGIALPAEAVATPARMAERFTAVAHGAAARLPFGAEPAGFQRVFAALADAVNETGDHDG